MSSEDYRSYLVECVKIAGQMIKDTAEDIVGETDCITDLVIEVNFDQAERASIPNITITRSFLPNKETIEHLLDIHAEKLKKGERKNND